MQVAPEPGVVHTLERAHGYPDLEAYMRQLVANLKGPLFTTTADNLFHAYISHLPVESQGHYRCHACKDFVNKYLSLVTIDERSIARPVFSDRDVPPFFKPAFAALWAIVAAAKVTSVFVTDKVVWGSPVTEAWTHLAGTPNKGDKHIFFDRPATRSAGQHKAALTEGFHMVKKALEEISQSAADEAHRILASGHLRNSEIAVEQAKWFKELPARGLNGIHRTHSLWRSVATSPEAFWHVRSNMLGTLLDALLKGESFAQISGSWAKKVAPLQYLRPQAPPSSGTVKRAEEIFAQLGLGPSLQRRFAKRTDILETFWEPRGPQEEPRGPGLFGHLETKDGVKSKVDAVELPRRVMTWAKFARDILPGAKKLQVVLDHYTGPYFGLTAAVNPLAPPLFKWDNNPERRNSVSGFFVVGGSAPALWSLQQNAVVDVKAIVRPPDEWFTPAPMTKAFFVLDGARYALADQQHNGIFPACIRKELHEVRAVIEAFSKTEILHGAQEGDANGLAFGFDGFQINLIVDGDKITLDRWE